MNKGLRFCFSMLLISLIAMTPLTQAWGEARDVVITFGANESPPFWSADMEGGGMCGSIVEAISREAGVHSTITFKPLQRLIQDDTGNDLGNPIFFMGEQDYSAIIPIGIYQTAAFYYAPNHDAPIALHGVTDLKKYRVGILKDTLLDRSYFIKEGVAFSESYSQESMFKKLRLGRIDVVLEIDVVGLNIIERLFPDEKEAFQEIILANSSNPITIMLAEDVPAVTAQQYRAALKRIIANGDYQRILERYYGEGEIPADWFVHLDRFRRLYSYGEDE